MDALGDGYWLAGQGHTRPSRAVALSRLTATAIGRGAPLPAVQQAGPLPTRGPVQEAGTLQFTPAGSTRVDPARLHMGCGGAWRHPLSRPPRV